MDSKIKHCIINAHNNFGWYQKGQDRLRGSLNYHGFNGDLIFLSGWPNDKYDKSCSYNIKAAALEIAIESGYQIVLWLDCSVWAIADPNKIFDVINEKGHYFWGSGYNCAQVCSDKCLGVFGISRDEAEKIKDCSSSMFGLNLSNPDSYAWAIDFINHAKQGTFKGSRYHDGQSKDPRFLFHRQDQSVASLLIHKYKMTITEPNVYSAYYPAQEDTVIFQMRGM